MAALVSPHAGHCCGMRSLFGFGHFSPETVRAIEFQWAAYLHDREERGDGNILCEVVLTDSQLRTGWTRWLREKNFRRVTRFRNANSGNMCNIFHHTPRRRSEADNRNDPWTQGRAAPRRRG